MSLPAAPSQPVAKPKAKAKSITEPKQKKPKEESIDAVPENFTRKGERGEKLIKDMLERVRVLDSSCCPSQPLVLESGRIANKKDCMSLGGINSNGGTNHETFRPNIL